MMDCIIDDRSRSSDALMNCLSVALSQASAPRPAASGRPPCAPHRASAYPRWWMCNDDNGFRVARTLASESLLPHGAAG